jgi:uncharacterized protein (TIGR02118 family)
MLTVFAIYNAKDAKTADEYENYLKEKKVALVRSFPFVESYEIYRIDRVLGPAVADPQNPPAEPPYQFVAKMEVASLDDFAKGPQTPEGKAFAEEYSAFLDPSAVFTIGHRIEPRA